MAALRVRGGRELERRLAEIGRSVTKAATLRVGFLENARYPDGTQVALVAAVNEFGAPSRGIPSRPFFRNMVRDKRREWPAAVAALLRSNAYDAAKALEVTGLTIGGQLRDSINNGTYVPNAPATVARKGFDKPLIDTSHMVNSISHEVE